MKRDEVFDEILTYIDTYLMNPTDNPYGAIVLPYFPSYEFDELPCIVLSQIDYRLNGEALNKNEKRHEIVIEAQVFAKTQNGIDKRVIANQVSDFVEDIIQNEYGLGLSLSTVVPNLDENIYRITQQFRGFIDDDSKIIYRQG